MFDSNDGPPADREPPEAVPGSDVASTPTERLEAQAAELAAHLAAATCRFLLMVAELDRRHAWGTWGVRSSAHWLSWHCGVGLGAAREQVRVANALAGLPKLTAEFAAGRLSYSKMRAMTRIATPQLEDELIELAKVSTAAQVERWVRGYRRAAYSEAMEQPPSAEDSEPEDAAGDVADADGSDGSGTAQPDPESGESVWTRAARGEFGPVAGDDAETSPSQGSQESLLTRPDVSWYFDEDGCLVFNARLPAEDGALLLAALDAARNAATAPTAAPDVSAETSNADAATDCGVMMGRGTVTKGEAFMNLIQAALESAPTDTSGADRYQVMVHIDRDALLGTDTGVRSGRCELRDGPSVSVHTAWRIACDSMFRAMYHDAAGRPVNFGRNQRLVTSAQRRLLLERDGGCAFHGCHHRRYLHAHHVRHWLHGGPTDMDNLILLCGAHHRMVHEGGLIVRAHGDGRFTFHTADGRLIRPAPLPRIEDIPLERLGAPLYQPPSGITPETMGGGWQGDRADTDAIVWGLLQQNRRTEPPQRPAA